MMDIGGKYPWLATFITFLITVSIVYVSYDRYIKKLDYAYNQAMEKYCLSKLDYMKGDRISYASYDKPVDDTFLPSREIYEWRINSSDQIIIKNLSSFEKSIMKAFKMKDGNFFSVWKGRKFMACGYAGTSAYAVIELENRTCGKMHAGIGFSNHSSYLGGGFNITEYLGNVDVIVLSNNNAFYRRLEDECW